MTLNSSVNNIISDNKSLGNLCQHLEECQFVCIDTEFMREGTYWPNLCLIQLADPGGDTFIIDPLTPEIELKPFFRLLKKKELLKIFHAARQDLEIFFNLTGSVPTPIFDTQIVAMVCGFGDSASYETLAKQLAGARLDKSSRFSNWSSRPLEKRQLSYARSDVAHLPKIYEELQKTLLDTGRTNWVKEETENLCSTDLYTLKPENAWERIKSRNAKPKTLAVLREVAAVRETWARQLNIPRQRLIKDESLLEVASSCPNNTAQLGRIRGFSEKAAKGKLGSDFLKAITRGANVPREQYPSPNIRRDTVNASGAVVDLLKVLLKLKCEQHGVAQKLVAKNSDLVQIAAGNTSVKALTGWRYSIFGSDALKLCNGTISLHVSSGEISISTIESGIKIHG